MEHKRENMIKQLQTVSIDEEVLKSLDELLYTASETGIIDIDFHGDDLRVQLMKLVYLAGKYKGYVPDELRM